MERGGGGACNADTKLNNYSTLHQIKCHKQPYEWKEDTLPYSSNKERQGKW